jgi:hypothetical protein
MSSTFDPEKCGLNAVNKALMRNDDLLPRACWSVGL